MHGLVSKFGSILGGFGVLLSASVPFSLPASCSWMKPVSTLFSLETSQICRYVLQSWLPPNTLNVFKLFVLLKCQCIT